jgi:hypothetical protein
MGDFLSEIKYGCGGHALSGSAGCLTLPDVPVNKAKKIVEDDAVTLAVLFHLHLTMACVRRKL